MSATAGGAQTPVSASASPDLVEQAKRKAAYAAVDEYVKNNMVRALLIEEFGHRWKQAGELEFKLVMLVWPPIRRVLALVISH